MYNSSTQNKIESLAGNRFHTDCYKLLVSNTVELPSIDEIAAKIRTKVNQKNASHTSIARAVQVDPVITAHLVKIANGSMYHDQQQVDSCSGALIRIGIKAAKSIIGSFVLNSSFTARSPLIKKKMNDLWAHSNYVAAISAILALKTPGFDPDRAMFAGLIHDIGMVPILVLADKNQEILDHPNDLDHTLKILKNDIGTQIVRNWGLPRYFEDIINHSENWLLDYQEMPNYTDIIITAQLLSYIGTHQMKNLPKPNDLPGYHKLAKGQLDAEISIKIIDTAKEEVQQNITFLG